MTSSAPFLINADGVAFLPLPEGSDAKKLRQACRESFEKLPTLRVLWTQAKRASPNLEIALKAGFIAATPLDTPNPVLCITPLSLQGLKEIPDAVL